MYNHNRLLKRCEEGAGESPSNQELSSSGSKTPDRTIPEIYQVVIECRHEREQRAVFERMRAEGFQCRVLTL
jgi:hypothetical protein